MIRRHAPRLAVLVALVTLAACDATVTTTINPGDNTVERTTVTVTLDGPAAENARSDPKVGAATVAAFKEWTGAAPQRSSNGDSESWTVTVDGTVGAAPVSGVGKVSVVTDDSGVATTTVDVVTPTKLIEAISAEPDKDAVRAILSSTSVEVVVTVADAEASFTGKTSPKIDDDGVTLSQTLDSYEAGQFVATGTPIQGGVPLWWALPGVAALIAAAVALRALRSRRRS